MAMQRIVIIGAGLAGLSTAWHLQKKGIDCRIFERAPEAGGLCRSKKIGEFTFDVDGHLLHFRHHYTFGLVKELLNGNLSEHLRSSWIYSHERYTRYPFQANLYGLPSLIVKECLVGFIESSKGNHRPHPATFLDWITQNFGPGIARHFMIPYNTKFWTIPPAELNCDWLAGFIPVPSLNQVIEGTIRETSLPLGYNARFWYPRSGGIQELVRVLADRLKNVHTGCDVVSVDTAKKEIRTASGERYEYDYLVSTAPLPELPRLLGRLPGRVSAQFRKLRWNSIFNLNLGIDQKDYLGRHWVYFPEREVSFFRVGFFHNFSASLAPDDKSSLYVEVSYSRDRPLDKRKVVPRIKEDLRRVGILGQGDGILREDINDIEYGYPVYDRHYHHARQEIMKYLRHLGIVPAGRYGSWRYMSMEDVLLDGKITADRLAAKL